MLTRILLAGILASALAFAQRSGGGGSRGGNSNMPYMGNGGTRLDRISDALKLTKDQKRDFKAAMDDAQKEATPIHDQMTQGRLAIAEAIAAGKSKEEVDKAVQGQAELETQMDSIELHAFAKIAAVLEPDQKQRGIQMMFAMVHGAFNGKNWNTDQQQP
jgi:Spy/CpxP family protein refolding chaperone